MNTKTLFKLVAMLAILTVLVAGNAFAGKWYVNVITGLDGYNGLSPTVGGTGVGPKATINNAITAATAGDTIYVDYGNGVLYNEAVNVNKAMVFGTTANNGSGSPVLFSLTIATGAPANNATFMGALVVNSGLTLTSGTVIGAGNLTIGTSVTRSAANATVDSQILFSGNIDFTYAVTMTTGGEMVAATNTTNCRNITTLAGTLTLGHSVTMKGILVAAGPLNLGAGTLTINGASVAHTIGGNVTNGTLAFSMTGAATITGAFTVPTVTATDDGTGYLLTLAGITTTGDITVSSKASVTAGAATTVGNVSNNGGGTVTLTAATATSSLTNTSSGAILVNAAGATTITGNVSQSGSGNILFNAGTSTSITGNVTNNPTLSITTINVAVEAVVNNLGVIRFVGDFPVTIGGNLLVQTTLTGSKTSENWTNVGEVSFANVTTVVTVTGTLTINSTHTLTLPTTPVAVSNNAGVTFANTTGNIVLGGVTNSSTWLDVTGLTMANNASLNAPARLAGTFAAGAVSNTSVTSTSPTTHCAINTGAAASTGANTATTVTTSGSTKGGVIYFAGDGATFTTTGTVNSARTTTGTYIQVGSAAAAGNAVSIGGDLVSSGSGTVSFAGFNGAVAEAVSVTGMLNVSGGTVTIPNGAMTGAGTISFGTISITGGTVNLVGAGAATMNIVTGNATFTSGTFSMTTTAARILQLGGLNNKFSGAATKTNFGTAAGDKNVTLLIQPTSVTALQTITGDATTTLWAGPLTVNNLSGLQPTVRFTGGNFRVLSSVTFTAGQVEVNGVTLFIGGQLAPAVGAGNFTNTAGYITTSVGANNGFISLNGNAAQTVGGAGTFANFEADNNVGVGAVAAAGTFAGTFNLTNGQVTGAGAIIFNNATNPPTIVVNNGSFLAAPTFTSTVNVYYIGIDKSTGFELPAAANKLNNLTVATTNGGITAGQGVVNIAVATTVNGTLNIFPGQALLLNGVSLTMKGATVTLDGDLVNNAAGSKLILAATTGTTITGSGVLPDISVAAGSVGNMISGSVGLATQLLGADNLRSPLVDDINPGATGSIIYAGGAASSLTVAFGTANATTKAHFQTLTTAAGATFTLGANLTEHQSGSMTVAAGTVDVGGFTFAHKGAAPSFDGGAAIISTPGTGKMQFLQMAATTLTITSSAATIAAPVEVSTSPAANAYTFTLAGFNLTASSTVTLSGTATFDLAALNLTVTGPSVTMNAGTAFAASGGGVLKLNAAAPPMTFAYTGATSIVNLTILADVALANGPGGAATALTVSGTLLHTAGNLNFGSINLTAGGVYTNTAGTYSATTGYLIYSGAGATFNQGAAGFSIPNLRFANAGAASATGAGIVTVTSNLDVVVGVGFAFTHTVGGVPTLAVATPATVNYTSGAFDVAPVYAGTITLVALNAATGTIIPSNVWPANTALVTTFTLNSAALANTVQIPGNRQVNAALKLTRGTLDLGTAAARTLTVADNSTITRKFGAAVALNGGTLAYGANETLVYQANGASVIPAVPNFLTGAELSPSITNLTFTRSANSANAQTQITTAVTVTGTLTIMNDVTTTDIVTGLPPVIPVNVTGNLVIATDAFALATAPSVAIGSLSFTGGPVQSATLAGPLTLTNLTLNMPAGGQVNLTGGNLTVTNLVFINGLLVVPSPYAVLLAGHNVFGQGFNHTGVVYPNLSHVVGNVQHAIAAGVGAAGTNGRFEFPVGGLFAYRPMAITFTPAYVANNPTNILVSMVDNSPAGVVGLPVDGGNGVRIGNYPNYFWLVQATPSSFTSTQAFDVDLQGTNLGYPFTNVNDLRIIRRQDGNATTNLWQLQGTAASYLSNFISVQGPTNSDSTIFVRSSSAAGGIVFQATRFTIGIPTRPPIFTAAPTTGAVDENQTLNLQFTAVSQNVNIAQTITYALVGAPAGATINASTGLFAWKPNYGQAGTYTFTVTANDGQFTTPTQTITVVVTRVNRPPVFSPKTITQTLTDKQTLTVALTATDPDTLSNLTYSVVSFVPTPTNAATISGSTLTWQPTFADAAKTYVLKVQVSDNVTTGHGPTPGVDTLTINLTVNRSRILGDVDGNGTVQAADASIVLQYVAGLIPLTDPAALYAADASKNGTISAYDAALILQAAAGIITLSNVAEDAHLGKTPMVEAAGSVSYGSPEATVDPMVVKVAMKLQNAANVYSVQLVSKGDMSKVTIDAVDLKLPEGWDMKWNVVGNELRVAMAGTTALVNPDLGTISVRLKDKESRLSFSTEALLNENAQSLGAVEIAAIPTVFALEHNYPNPFNPSTTIKYQIANNVNVTLDIYNVQGQKIRTLVSTEQKAGYYSVVWDGRNEAGQTVSSGLYLYRVQAGSFVATQKMLMLK